jgi:transcription elongation factor GreA
MTNDRVGIGLKVKVIELATNETMEFAIVGSTEADPFEGKISNESLVGAALIGKMLNEIAEVQVPDGVVSYKVIDITK